MSGQLIGPIGVLPAPSGGGGGSLTFTPTDNPAAVIGGGITSPVNFSTVAVGAGASDRIIVAVINNKMAANSANALVSAVTVDVGGGPISMTLAAAHDASQQEISIWWLLVTGGGASTASFSVTITGGTGWSDAVGLKVGTLTGSAAASVSSTLTTTPPYYAIGATAAGAIAVATGGVAVIGAITDNNPSPGISWTNTTSASSDFDQAIGAPANAIGSLAHATASATVTLTTGTNAGCGWLSASFAP